MSQETGNSEIENSLTQEVVLSGGRNYSLQMEIPTYGQTPIIATIEAGEKDTTTIDGERPDTFQVIDLRNASFNQDGTKNYKEYSIDPSVKYLLLGKNPDLTYGRNYKGIRSGEGEILFGRFDENTMEPSDVRKRFDLSKSTSRNHFSITATEGRLDIKDLNSLNGTILHVAPETLPDIQNYDLIRAEDVPTQEVKPTEQSEQEKILVEEIVNREDQFDLTLNLARNPDSAPTEILDIDDQKFLLSRIQDGERRFAVLYSKLQDGRYAPRLLYKSNSEGGWRMARLVWPNGNLDKGKFAEDGAYTQETKPTIQLVEKLQAMEEDQTKCVVPSRPSIVFEFDINAVINQEFDTYEDETSVEHLSIKSLYNQSPGIGFTFKDGKPAREHFANLELPEDFTPDFTQPPKSTYSGEHTLLGSTNVDVYPVVFEGRQLEWHIASDISGRVWIDRIRDINARVTSYGTESPVVLAGILNNKPVEYRSQISGLEYGVDFEEINSRYYTDITKLLDNLPVIKEYRTQRGIERKTT